VISFSWTNFEEKKALKKRIV